MAWSSLASNQMVNQDDAQSSPFSLNSGQSHGSGTQCFTKDAALTKYNLDASVMSGFASNQLVPKSSWVAGAVANAFTFGPDVSATASGSCLLSTTGYTVYSADTVLGPNSLLFQNAAMTLPAFQNGTVYGNPYINSSYGPMRLTVNSEYCFISSYIGSCSGVSSFSFGTVDSGSSAGACSGGNTGRTLYSNSTILSTGNQLYTDQYLMFKFTPGDGTQSYYLHSGSNSYRVTSSGIIDLITACTTGVSFPRDSIGYSTRILSCDNASFNSTFYGTDNQFVVGDTVYTNSSLTTTFNGSNLWWAVVNLASSESIRIGTNGVITARGAC